MLARIDEGGLAIGDLTLGIGQGVVVLREGGLVLGALLGKHARRLVIRGAAPLIGSKSLVVLGHAGVIGGLAGSVLSLACG